MKTRRKEAWITLGFFLLFLLVGHLGVWFVLFPVAPTTRFLGFPAHYALALLASWPGLLIIVAVYARAANRLDNEIANSDANADDSSDQSSS